METYSGFNNKRQQQITYKKQKKKKKEESGLKYFLGVRVGEDREQQENKAN